MGYVSSLITIHLQYSFNPNKRNAMGRPVTYALHPGLNSFPYAHPSSWFMKRASWLKYHFWVTRFNEHEKYPSGEHPNQSDGKSGGMGLEAMSNQNRNIENTGMSLLVCLTV